MQLIGECVGLVMAPVIFYYLYYQVSTPCIIFACQYNIGPVCIMCNCQPHADCLGVSAYCTLHGCAIRSLCQLLQCCSVAGPMTACFALHDT